MVVREASIRDWESIAKIWRACFTDDEDYIYKYLNHCLPYTNTWVLGEENGDIYSCASVIPSFIILGGKKIYGGYLYGVGTLPDHRGKSYSRIITEKIVDYHKTKGYSYLLVKPATIGLFDLYKRLGFDKELLKTSYTQNFENIDKGSINWRYQKIFGSIKLLSPENLVKFREEQQYASYFMWPLAILRYALSEALDRSGQAFYFEKISIEGHTKRIYVIGYPDESDKSGKTFKILECNASTLDDFEDIYSVLRFTGNSTFLTMKADIPGYRYEKLPHSNIDTAALYMELRPGVSSFIEKLHLSLPME
jgi:ribosomal protein S18 acetylase RimI-like enzyme